MIHLIILLLITAEWGCYRMVAYTYPSPGHQLYLIVAPTRHVELWFYTSGFV